MSKQVNLNDEYQQVKISHEDGAIYIREPFGDAVLLTLSVDKLAELSAVINDLIQSEAALASEARGLPPISLP